MAICDGCQQDNSQLFRCSRCHRVVYCSKDCQRTAWPSHKQACNAQQAGAGVAQATQMAILLDEGFELKAIQIPAAPVHIATIRQYLPQHKRFKDSDFLDILMPMSDRLLRRALRIVYNASPTNDRRPSTFGTRDTSSLEWGLGPDVRGQVSSS